MARELTDAERAAGFEPFAVPVEPPVLDETRIRVYRCSRDRWRRVHCHVQGRDLAFPVLLENVGFHSPDGFEMGYVGDGPADLALTILLHHLGVPVEEAREAYRGGNRTGDIRVLQAWMSHERLREQRLVRDTEYVQVNELELSRLLVTKFLTVEVERDWDAGVAMRERVQRLEGKKKSHAFHKPGKGEE